MTVRFLQSWNGYQPDAVVSGLANEATLIAAGIATSDTDGANDGRIHDAKFITDASGNVTGLDGPEREICLFGAENSKILDVRAFGAKVDGVCLYDATCTNSATPTITSATASFVSTDVGKWCTILPNTDTAAGGSLHRRGTITAVNSATSVTCTLNGSPGAIAANGLFVYGTDDADAFDAALAKAKLLAGASVFVHGCMLSKRYHVVPSGVHLRGVGNQPMGGGQAAKDFRHNGSSIICVSYDAAHDFITLGDAGITSPLGATLSDINIDCLDMMATAVNANTRTAHIRGCTILRGNSNTLVGSPSATIMYSSVVAQNQGTPLVAAGDSTIGFNKIIGAGNGNACLSANNADDLQIIGSHIWKGANQPTMLGSLVKISKSSGDVNAGGVSVIGNRFDTPFGASVEIDIQGNSTLRGLSVVGNISMTNDAVPNATYPFMDINVGSGSSIRGFTVTGNQGRGSWNDPTKGTLASFIDGAGISGNVYASSVVGNVMDNCAAGYVSFTPNYTAGNHYLIGTGTTVNTI